ncbi:MAG TPA: fructosamine kinase family protein, partial [Saprospiraceae bacterium]|nr:fructosamine kinase family protein [Saprospiraceae bacterium]
MLPPALLQHLESALRVRLTPGPAVKGGDIHQAVILLGDEGQKLFVKYNRAPSAADMFRTEAQGLALLGASRVVAVPHIHAHGEADGGWAYLVLDFVASGPRSRLFWEKFGTALANLHGNTSEKFGFAHDNFIGSLPQSNRRHDTWTDFYAAERLLPQTRLARDGGYIDSTAVRLMEKCCARLGRLCPEEAPALIHGDLWSGNFLCNTDGEPVLIVVDGLEQLGHLCDAGRV